MNARGPKGPRRSWSDVDTKLFDKAHESTSGQRKIWNYLQAIVEEPEIDRELSSIRARHKAPSLQLLMEVDKVTSKLGLDMPWTLVLAEYVLHKKLNWSSSFGGLLEITDHQTGVRPISLNISPYASQRDVIDFVKKIYRSEIEPLQKKYRDPRVKIGKIKKRNDDVAKVRRYIVANRALGSRKLVSMIADKFGKIMDYNYVSKIIRDEKGRRK